MFRGCFVAIVTPFRDGSIDFPALENLVNFIVDGGVNGLVPCGTTGESPTLDDDEHAAVVAAVVKYSRGRAPVVAGCGTNCTRKTIKLSQNAIQAGADGVMLVSPYYNKPNQTGLYQHFSAVASRIDVPIMLYNIPGRTGVEISVDTIARLHGDHSNIEAVKHATANVDGASQLAAISDITILAGDDTLTLPLMSIGAVGVVSVLGNLMPREMCEMVNAAMNDDFETAGKWHSKLFPLARDLLTLDINPIPIKTALAMKGLVAEEFRLPMCPLDPAKKMRLQTMISGIQCQAPEKQPA
ncbi:MAG TPA: 4-hydroxy-tetrahydrodipicolinate synthase [Phycisphaerae bacterium]|nr:4-hydroxy-tetrahydrodipicolinate synthase [Phycisphaerae bacterium]